MYTLVLVLSFATLPTQYYKSEAECNTAIVKILNNKRIGTDGKWECVKGKVTKGGINPK